MRIEKSVIPIPAQSPPAAPKPADNGFGGMLMDAMQEVNASHAQAKGLQDRMMAGQPVELHDLMIAMERASTATSLTLQVRNKLLEAYQEINRMQV